MKFEEMTSTVVHPLTKKEYKVITKRFFAWAKDKTEDFILHWYKQESDRHLAEELKKWMEDSLPSMSELEFAENFNSFMETEKMTWNYEYIPNEIANIKKIGYENYKHNQAVMHIEDFLELTEWFCEESCLTLIEKIELAPLLELFNGLSRNLKGLSNSRIRYHQIIHEVAVAESMQCIEKCTYSPSILEISNSVYNSLSDALKKAKTKKEINPIKEKLEILKLMYDYITKKGFKHLCIYKNMSRLPGAGWSNQK